MGTGHRAALGRAMWQGGGHRASASTTHSGNPALCPTGRSGRSPCCQGALRSGKGRQLFLFPCLVAPAITQGGGRCQGLAAILETECAAEKPHHLSCDLAHPPTSSAKVLGDRSLTSCPALLSPLPWHADWWLVLHVMSHPTSGLPSPQQGYIPKDLHASSTHRPSHALVGSPAALDSHHDTCRVFSSTGRCGRVWTTNKKLRCGCYMRCFWVSLCQP